MEKQSFKLKKKLVESRKLMVQKGKQVLNCEGKVSVLMVLLVSVLTCQLDRASACIAPTELFGFPNMGILTYQPLLLLFLIQVVTLLFKGKYTAGEPGGGPSLPLNKDR